MPLCFRAKLWAGLFEARNRMWWTGLRVDAFVGRTMIANEMDGHNNRVGALIGAKAGSFSEIEPAVRDAVAGGCVSAGDAGRSRGFRRASGETASSGEVMAGGV